MGARTGSLATKTGYQGTQSVVTPGVTGTTAAQAGPIQGLMAANFEETDTYTLQFNITAATVLPIPTPSPVWPPRNLDGTQPPIPSFPQPVGSSTGVRCVAIINWKVEGNQIRREIDIGSGVSISGTSQAVDVAVQDQTWTVGGPAGVQYSVSVVCTKGVRPSTALPPVLTATTNQSGSPDPTVVIPPGGIVLFDVPENVGITSVEVTAIDVTTPGDIPTFLVVGHFDGVAEFKTYSATTNPGFVKLSPGSTQINMRNRSSTDTVQCSVTWGIDG